MGIDEEEIAFAFDIECNEILTEWEMENEQKRIEAASGGLLTRALAATQEPAAQTARRKEGSF